jgi:hypothetical protein
MAERPRVALLYARPAHDQRSPSVGPQCRHPTPCRAHPATARGPVGLWALAGYLGPASTNPCHISKGPLGVRQLAVTFLDCGIGLRARSHPSRRSVPTNSQDGRTSQAVGRTSRGAGRDVALPPTLGKRGCACPGGSSDATADRSDGMAGLGVPLFPRDFVVGATHAALARIGASPSK